MTHGAYGQNNGRWLASCVVKSAYSKRRPDEEVRPQLMLKKAWRSSSFWIVSNGPSASDPREMRRWPKVALWPQQNSRWAFSAPMTLSFSRTLPSTLMIDDELIQKIWWSFEDISFESSIVDSINDYGRHSNANNSRKGAFSLTKENVSRIDLRLNEDG